MYIEHRHLPIACSRCTNAICEACPVAERRAEFDRWVAETRASASEPTCPTRFTALRPGVDRRALPDRERRALEAFVVLGGDEERWGEVAGSWTYAAEWFENRPSDGLTPGERLHACTRRFIEQPAWARLDVTTQATWEHAAGKLHEARWAA